MKESDVVLSLFSHMGRAIRARMTRECPLPFAQCEILAFVADHQSPTMRDVAKYFNITAPSATSLVEGLVRHAMLSRAQDPRDRRAVRLVLTAKGKRTASTLAKRKAKVLGGMLSKLDPDDKRDLERILRRLTADL